MAEDNSDQEPIAQPQPNALATFPIPKLDLVGPTVDDDVRRAIWRYGAEAVKKSVKEATKAKRGRKREPDWPELRDIIETDARDWLAGKDPFATRKNYSIAKAFAERNPGQSAISTHKRIERKLSSSRRWVTLVTAENLSRDAYPYQAHLRALRALSELPELERDVWESRLERALATIADYEARQGHAPPETITFCEIEETVRRGALNALLSPPQPSGMFGAQPRRLGFIGSILSDTINPKED